MRHPRRPPPNLAPGHCEGAKQLSQSHYNGITTQTAFARNDKCGFTLAEVLITLAIIGVVAALTIPTLVSNYQKKQWVTGLQKGYATLSNVFKLAMADDGVDNFTQTSLWNSVPINSDGARSTTDSNIDYSEFVANLQKYMKINKFCNPTESKNDCFNIEYKALNGNNESGALFQTNRLKIYAADGIVYYFRLIVYNSEEALTNGIEIDVNGDNPPNQYGRDLLEVVPFNNGKILFTGTAEWENIFEGNHWNQDMCNPKHNDFYYNYCGARIFENGWRMDY